MKHPGNVAYRKLVNLNRKLYATCLKTEKLRISKSIVDAIRDIGGRFVECERGRVRTAIDERDEHGNVLTWRDIGDKRAVEKTSQSLREGQAKLLKKLKEEVEAGGDGSNPVPLSEQLASGPLRRATLEQLNGPLRKRTVEQLADERRTISQELGGIPSEGFTTPAPFAVQNPPGPEPRFFGYGESMSSYGAKQRRSFNVRMDSGVSTDSWGAEDPVPLSHADPFAGRTGNHDTSIFSKDVHDHLMYCLDMSSKAGGGSNRASISFKPGTAVGAKRENRDSSTSVLSAMSMASIASAMSEITSIMDCEALSLDSAIDALERDAEFDMLGAGEEFDVSTSDVSLNPSCESAQSQQSPDSVSLVGRPRRSILRRGSKWTSGGTSFPLADASANQVDPGMIFTSTLDAKPGGVNSGRDVSDLVMEPPRSVVMFENDVNRRRSSRMSLSSVAFGGLFKREVGSTLTIGSTDFREFLDDLDEGED